MYIKTDGSAPVNASIDGIDSTRVLPDKSGQATLLEEIAELRQTKAALRLNEARLESLLRISQHKFTTAPELMDVALEEALLLTGSKIGFINYFDEETRQFTRNSWSRDVMDECRICGSQTGHPLEEAGMWAEAVRQRRPIVINDFHAPHPLMKGYPEGHAVLHRFMSIPVFSDSSIVAAIGVANKASAYDDADIRQLTLLMDAVWKIVQQKRTEESRNKALAFAEALLAQSPMGVRVFDGETGGCIMANQAAADIAEGNVEALLRQNFRKLRSWSEARLTPLADQVLDDGQARRVETDLHTTFGKQKTVAYYLSRFVVEEKQHLLVFGRDITERKRLEEENRRIEEQMLHVQKLESLGVLAGGIAHDFNNILMTVLGNADLALIRLAPASPARDNILKIEQAARQAADLARQMLAYSGRGQFVIETLDLNAVIEEMSHMLELSTSKKALLRYNLAGNIPAIDADATQMRQIIMNLVINASEAIGERSGVIAISTGVAECDRDYLSEMWIVDQLPEGLYVFLEIADTGCGMDRETASKIFEPFFTTKFAGRGLGMAATLGIIRGHKGAIKVYSEKGIGTTFKILLPVSGGDRDRPPALLPSSQAWQGSGTVLLVDDEETIRALGQEMLTVFGYRVLTACDGRDALEVYRRNRDEIVCVILDLTMPHMDGEQAFRELRRECPGLRVIISSGYNEQDVARRFVGKGLAGFIQKPYKLSELRQKMREIFEIRQ